jgi:3'(2'), 5'-bisphosphate nucleotidase
MDKQLIIELKKVITAAGRMALDYREAGLKVEIKQDGSPVTNADKEISSFIYSNLSNLTPTIPIICEERPIVAIDKSKSFWLIDPIDGTRSYISDKDSFTVNMAVVDNQKAEYGFVYQPTIDRLYYTDENKKFCIEVGGKAVSHNMHSQDGFVAVVSSRSFNEKTASYLKSNNFSEIIAVPSSIKLCMIAEGASDVYPKFGPTMEWDIAAGHALICAAGGDVVLQDGQTLRYAKESFENPQFLAISKQWRESK